MEVPAAPVITLTTDFGLSAAYVGIMKGVILSRCPTATIIDISHDVPPQEIRAAAYLIETSWQYFPAGTFHVVVVDPGVGSERKILAAKIGSRRFLAPDNGVLTSILDLGTDEIFSVENEEHFLNPVSQTFHGRDIFAPVAAELANGTGIGALGPRLEKWVTVEIALASTDEDGRVTGEVIYIDSFGNLITNIEAERVSQGACIEVAGRQIEGLVESYASTEAGELLAIIGSTGRLEISVNGGNARDSLGVDYREPVVC